MPSGPALVIRLSSLGDVLLAGHLPSLLRRADPNRRVLFAVKERYADVLRRHPDVDRFYMLEDGSRDPAAPAPLGVTGSTGDLRAALKREGVAEIIDLQQNVRSSRITATLEGARRVPFEKHGFRRRRMVHARWTRPEPLPPLLRRYRALAGLPPDASLRPWLRDALTPEERTRAREDRGPDLSGGYVILAAGSRWATKRWPVRHVAAFAALLERETGLSALIAVGPDEGALGEALAAALPASGARAIVSNDSAFLHLGPALGVAAVGLFGSTVPAFGFASGEPTDAVAEIELDCRPCDVHGKDRCPKGHHACLERLEPGLVLDRLKPLLASVDPTP
jgi:heptosyltransferase-2